MGLWKMSVSGGILILVILAVRRLFRNRLPGNTFLILWMVALIRLLFPVSVTVPYNIYTLLEDIKIETGFGNLADAFPFGEYGVDTSAQGNIEQEFVEKSSSETIEGNFAENDKAEQEWSFLQNSREAGNGISLWVILYLAGVLLCAGFYLITYLKCRREFETSLPVKDDMIEAWVRSFSIKRRVQVRQSGLVATPMTYGVIHPVILLPRGIRWENPRQMQFVLTHELVHIRRFDAAAKLLLIIAVCVHWWNPLVWIMNILANRDMELACDEKVLQYFGQESRKAYALSLLSLAERKNSFMVWGSSFSKDVMEERIVAIMKKKKPTLGAMAGAAVLIVFVTVLFATSAAQESTQETYMEAQAQEFEDPGDDRLTIRIPVPDIPYVDDNIGLEESDTYYEKDSSEDKTGFINLLENVYHSEEFPEYEKFGLSYDEKNKHFLYQGKVVGYFKDEMEPGLFRQFVDESGFTNLVVVRDASGNMTGFHEKALEAEDTAEYVEQNDTTFAAMEETSVQAQESVSGDAIEGSGNTAIEGGGNATIEFPQEYQKYGVTEEGMYKEKRIAVLYDAECFIYCDGCDGIPEAERAYLLVQRDSKGNITSFQEMTKEEMQKSVSRTGLDIS